MRRPFSLEIAGNRNLTITAAAAGFMFASRAVLVLVSARWLNVGTEPGVSAGFLAPEGPIRCLWTCAGFSRAS
jgi:hypothetical protein